MNFFKAALPFFALSAASAQMMVSGIPGAPSPAPAAPAQPAAPAELSFEDKLKQFMSVSDSKQSELNRYMASKRGGRRRK